MIKCFVVKPLRIHGNLKQIYGPNHNRVYLAFFLSCNL